MSAAAEYGAKPEYFVSRTAAIQYYAAYDYTAAEVDRKIKGKEIVVRKKPFTKSNQIVVEFDSRYWATERGSNLFLIACG